MTFQIPDALLTVTLYFIRFIFTDAFKCLKAKFLNCSFVFRPRSTCNPLNFYSKLKIFDNSNRNISKIYHIEIDFALLIQLFKRNLSHSKLKNSRQNKYHTLSFHLNNYFNFELNCIIKYDHTTTNMFLN